MLEVPLPQWAAICAVAGVVTGLLLNIPMVTQSEGYLPAYVAAGGLSGADPTEVNDALTVAVHHVVAVVASLFYGAVVAVLSLVLPTAVSLGGLPLVPHLVGAVSVTVSIFAFFARIAVPRFGGSLRDRADEVVEQWALTAFIYGATLALLVPVLVIQF